MLFNSYEFVLLFLPIVLLGFYAFSLKGFYKGAILWLVGASLFFYGWWNPAYLYLLLCSIVFNYAIGINLGSLDRKLLKKWVLTGGIVGNLSLLGYFKYTNFYIENFNALFNAQLPVLNILFPVGVSFYTFQQISYLVDCHGDKSTESSFSHYLLFVTFFPQLIAGPIVRYKEIAPQFLRLRNKLFNWKNVGGGIFVFSLGLQPEERGCTDSLR